jgi:hypothetical protein
MFDEIKDQQSSETDTDMEALGAWMSGGEQEAPTEAPEAPPEKEVTPEVPDTPTELTEVSDEADTGLYEAYKDIYGEEPEPDVTPEQSHVTNYEENVSYSRNKLIDEHKELSQLLATEQSPVSLPAELQSFRGKPLGELTNSEAGQYLVDVYDNHGQEMLLKAQNAFTQVERNNALAKKVEQYQEKLDAHQWDEAVMEVVKKAPSLVAQVDKLRTKVEEVLLRVNYPQGDMEGKRKVLKTAVRSMLTVPTKKHPVQTPEAGLGASGSNIASGQNDKKMTDEEIVESVLKGEFDLFSLPNK